jgi:signal transduction histidine kinase
VADIDARKGDLRPACEAGKTTAKPRPVAWWGRRGSDGGGHDVAMRRELVRASVAAAWIGLAVLALPLAVAVYLLVLGNEQGELERAALQAVTQVDASFTPAPEPGSQLGQYDLSGRLRAGTGPAQADPVTRQALRGTISRARQGGMLVAAVPASSGEAVTSAVRVASPAAVIYRRTALAWAGLALAATLALGAAVLVARRRARRLAAPLEQLAAVSHAVGQGDLGARMPPCGIAEIDRVSSTQNATVARLGDLLERERQFTANASHQLRTPLAGLQLILETARDRPDDRLDATLEEALATTRRLQTTIEEVLALHRETGAAPGREHGTSVPAASADRTLEHVLDDAVSRWRGPLAAQGRALALAVAPALRQRPVDAGRVAQILDVLLDNALQHGGGQVRVIARPAGPATAVDVSDEGRGIPDEARDLFRRGSGTGHGIGLSLAREFAVSLGGRLVLSTRTPPVFTFVLPAPDHSDDRGGTPTDERVDDGGRS